MARKRTRSRAGHVVVVGSGGNIGSHLVPHLARMVSVRRLTLVDPDVYDASNLRGQQINARDVGRKKVRVQRRRLTAIDPTLSVVALAEPVESVPRALLRGDVILACLDSRRARQAVSEAAVWLGVPWMDAGVSGDGLLARVDVYRPGAGEPCLECAWDERDYADLEQEYPCQVKGGKAAPGPATAASSSLGALAASLQAIETEKLLAASEAALAGGTQILLDAARHKHYVTRFRRNPGCRLSSHGPQAVEPLAVGPEALTLGEAFALTSFRRDAASLSVDGKSIVRAFACGQCGHRRDAFALVSTTASADARCRACGGRASAPGLDRLDAVTLVSLSSRWLGRSLGKLGFRRGEIVTVSDARRRRHFELAGGSDPEGGSR